MGSFFAGIKAGTLGGILYFGGLAVFNVAILYALQSEFLAWVESHGSTVYGNTTLASACPLVPSVNGTSATQCLSLVASLAVPVWSFVGFFVGLAFAGLLGTYYDSLPTRSPTVKGGMIAALLAIVLVTFIPVGFFFNLEVSALTSAFLVVWTGVFGFVLGGLYRRYSRLVTVESQDTALLKVVVDGKDLTGKARTFALSSIHRLRAEVSNDASFREWEASGGLAVEDLRSFETVLEVNGEGTLKGIVTRKY